MDLIENELILKLLEFVELEVCFGFALSESEIRHSQVLNACGSFLKKTTTTMGHLRLVICAASHINFAAIRQIWPLI